MQLPPTGANPQARFAPMPAFSPAPPTPGLRLIGITMTFARGQEICGQGESAEYVYKVVRGAVRCFRVLADGRRQISDFYLPGDVFGVEAGVQRRATAEALVETTVVVARRSTLIDDGDGPTPRALWRQAVAELQRSEAHVLTLGRRSATERVASFLADLSERLGERDALELPMSRQDMADYLGLTIETVSRTLTQLQAMGLIELQGARRVRIRRPQAMADLCE